MVAPILDPPPYPGDDDDRYELDGEAGHTGPLKPGYVSEHFREAEFACNHCHALPPNGIHLTLIETLEVVREYFGAPVVINSGYRCPTHNRNVGGAKRSQHLLGTAADIRVVGVSPSKVHAFLKEYRDGLGGLGKYKTFTHVDVGPNGRRWHG